jgi:hypothetical protein
MAMLEQFDRAETPAMIAERQVRKSEPIAPERGLARERRPQRVPSQRRGSMR